MAYRVFFLNRLREGVDADEYESWIRRVDYPVLGNAVNVAARREEFVAQPGDVVIGPQTYGAIESRFECAQLGYFALKGLSTQVPLYKVLASK